MSVQAVNNLASHRPAYAMMKFIVTPILLALAAGVQAQDLESLGTAKDYSYFQLRGAPVTVTTRTLKPPKDTLIVPAAAPVATGPSWGLQKEEQWQFDTSGVLLKASTRELQRKKEELHTVQYTYSKPGKRLQGIGNYDKDRLTDSAALRYNKSGQLLQYIATDGKGKPAFRVTYTYDRKKQLTIIRKLNEDDFPVEMIKYKYAASGLLTETQHFDRNFRQVATKRYSIKRDKDGILNMSSASYNDLNALMDGYTQVKDASGHVTEESQVDKDRRVTEYKGYEYNEQGDVVAEKVIGAAREEHRVYRYRYDDHNNWTSREVYINDLLETVEERSLAY